MQSCSLGQATRSKDKTYFMYDSISPEASGSESTGNDRVVYILRG